MASEPFVHAQILVMFDQRRAIDLLADMIIDYQKGRGPKDSPNFSERLKDEVSKLSGHCGKHYNQVMYAAREGDFTYLHPLLASPKTTRDANVSQTSSRSSPQRQRQPARFPPAPTPPPMQLLSPSSPTPPGSMHSGNSESRSSAEHIHVLDPASNNNEVRLSVKYSGLGLNFIRERALDQFDGCRTEECDEVRETHPDATGPDHLFVASSYTKLTWYRPQWRKMRDYRTKQDTFYIVENLDSVAVLHGDSFPPQVLDQPERAMGAGLQQREFHRGGRSLFEPTTSYMLPVGGYQEPEFGYNGHQDLPRDFPGRVHQPQARADFGPQQRYHDIETRFQASGSGSGPQESGEEAQQQQYTSNNPSAHDDYNQNGGSEGVVWVKWLSDGGEATENLDLNAPVQHFKDKLREVLVEYLEIDPNLDLYKLKFCTPASKSSAIVKFKGKDVASVWEIIVKWMQKNDPGNEPYQCQINKVASQT